MLVINCQEILVFKMSKLLFLVSIFEKEIYPYFLLLKKNSFSSFLSFLFPPFQVLTEKEKEKQKPSNISENIKKKEKKRNI